MPIEPAGPVAGIVLAAGASTRMGRNKLLLPLGGETVLRRAVVRARDAGLDPVIVVLGHEGERANLELAGLPCQTVANPDYALGIESSLRVGFAALPPASGAAVVLLADMPFVTAAMIGMLVERYRASAAPLVISDFAGISAPPTLFDRSLFAELQQEGCGKRIARLHRSEAAVVSWPAEALADLDLPEDFARIAAQTAAG
jgi:molybdenum cofactor cytidylyltransferase